MVLPAQNMSYSNMQQYQVPNNWNGNNLINNTPYQNYMNRGMQQSNQFLKCRPVSSIQEARAFQIDLDGSLWVFTDVGNGKIYTKQINNDGTATFNTYALSEEQPSYSATPEYVTKEEFSKTVQSLMAAIQSNMVSVNNSKKEDSAAAISNF